MSLKDFEVIEWFVDNESNITGHCIRPKIKRPDLIKNIVPNNFDFEYRDKYGNYRYRYENNTAILKNIIPTDEQLKKEDFNKKELREIMKIIINGIENKDDPEFINLKNMVGL